jgi:hypothetical protein
MMDAQQIVVCFATGVLSGFCVAVPAIVVLKNELKWVIWRLDHQEQRIEELEGVLNYVR